MKPNSFVLGVVELFAVFLPGVVVAGALVALFGLDASTPFGASAEVAALLLIALAYLCGALLNAAASALLDILFERSHGPGREPEEGAPVNATWARLWRIHEELRTEGLLVPGQKRDNPFRAVRAYLHLALPRAAAEVERLEAEQKLFRTMSLGACVVGFVLFLRPFCAGTHPALCETPPPLWQALVGGSTSFIVAVLAYERYAQLRLKTIDSAYTFFLFRHAAGIAKKTSDANAKDGEEE